MNIKRLFNDANISEKEQLYLYKDPAYTESFAIMRVYKRPRGGQLTADKKKFNKKISRKQMLVKHEFEFV